MKTNKEDQKKKSKVLREVMDEIIREKKEKKERTSYPHWGNWGNWGNWNNWWT